ncbi:MAG: hypothetical protein ABWY20_12590 [Mycobacterium sp.]
MTYGWVTEDAEMRTLGQWKNYVAGWKGLHQDDPTDPPEPSTAPGSMAAVTSWEASTRPGRAS